MGDMNPNAAEADALCKIVGLNFDLEFGSWNK